MNITRDVILDLWPAYQAGEVSDETRALVDQFLASDPEFAAILRKVGDPARLLRETPGGPTASADEKRTIEKARSRVVAQWMMLAAAAVMTFCLLAMLVGGGFLLLTTSPPLGFVELIVIALALAVPLGLAGLLWWGFARLVADS